MHWNEISGSKIQDAFLPKTESKTENKLNVFIDISSMIKSNVLTLNIMNM